MQQALRPFALVPLGFVVENATCDGATTVITVRRASSRALVRDAGRVRSGSTVAISAASPTCPWRVGRFASSS